MDPSFTPSRLSFARRRRGVTKQATAAAVGVDPRAFTAYERGEYPPSAATLERIASVLGFPESFFSGEDLAEVPRDSISFRALTKRTSSEVHQANAQGTQAVRLSTWLDEKLNLPAANLPDLRDHTPEAAAEALRDHWRFSDKPILPLIRTLERHGVRVFTLALESENVDAFSFFDGDRPFMLLNTRKSAERSRFDAAHELAHLVLHRHGAPQGQEAEAEAHKFASSFLMPSGSVIARAPKFAHLNNLIAMKSYWAVSLSALVRRLADLKIINSWQYRTLNLELSQAGYRTDEPNPCPREGSYLWPKTFAMLKEKGYTKAKIAKELHMTTRDLDGMVSGLTMTSIEGGRTSTPSPRDAGSGPSLLKVK